MEEEEKGISRRDYQKITSAAIAGLAIGGMIGYVSYPALNPPIERKEAEKTIKKTAKETVEKVVERTTIVPPKKKSKVVIVKGEDLTYITKQAINMLGGINSIMSKGGDDSY